MAARHLASMSTAAFLVALTGLSAKAAEFDLGVSAGVGASDNITRVAGDEVDETMATAGLDLRIRQEGTRLDTNVDGLLAFVDYLDDTFGSEVVGHVSADLQLGLIPERLIWVVQDDFGQTRGDPFAPVTADNRENINYFSTGPDLILRLGSAGFARVYGRYSNVRYEDRPLDNDRLLGGLSLGRQLSQTSNISLNAVHESLEYDDSLLNPDYDRQSAFIRMEGSGSRTSLVANLGYTNVDREGDTASGLLASVELERNISAASTLRLTGGTEFTDAGSTFSELQPGLLGGIDSGAVDASADVYERRYVTLAWMFQRNRTSFGLSLSHDDNSYERDVLLDRARSIASLTLERQVTRAMVLRLLGEFIREDFDNVAFKADDWRAGIGGSWNFSRSLALNLDLDHFDRSGSGAVTGYTENRAFLTLSYRYSRQD